ncbi:MAG: DUF285 domain-containing protein [Lachnospiraceae bacterium]|nr:DUF285 domain-containing protein [Lachnospiraceae bacterium]
MKKRLILTGIIFLILTLLSFPVFAGEPPSDPPETDEWIFNWDYEIREIGYDGTFVVLNQYLGESGEVTIYGKATVEGIAYPVCISAICDDVTRRYSTGINRSDNIVSLTFESVDGIPVRSERKDRMDDFFSGMSNLKCVHFGGNFDGSIVQAGNMFYGCENLEEVDIENLDLSKTTIFSGMFENCKALRSISMECPSGANFAGMFAGCTALTDISLNGGSEKMISTWEMFSDCISLKNISLSGLDFSQTMGFRRMFYNCASLEEIDMGIFDFSSALELDEMFCGCESLTSVDLSAATWNGEITSTEGMFSYCLCLEEVTLSEAFKPSAVCDMFKTMKPTLLRIKGTMSREFRENVLPYLKRQNRYIGLISVQSLIELEGGELKDGIFALSVGMEDEDGNEESLTGVNEGSKTEVMIRVYSPGRKVVEVREMIVSFMGEGVIISVPISGSRVFSCEDPERTKTVDITMNADGSLAVVDVS